MLVLHCLYLLICSLLASDKVIANGCVKAELPLRNGEMRPLPFIVHVWVNTVDSGERSCLGVIKKGNNILVPEWCITTGGEKRGRIAIYAAKPMSQITFLSPSSLKSRYVELFDLIYVDDDLSRLEDGLETRATNAVNLKIPKDISNLTHTCFWRSEDVFSKTCNSSIVSWRRSPNGDYLLVQELIDESKKRKRSFEELRSGIEDITEAVFSVSKALEYWIFNGFFKRPYVQ